MTSSQPRTESSVLRVQPFRGVRFTSRAGDLGDLTFTPPPSWSSVPEDRLARLDAHHVMRLVAPAFAGDPLDGSRQVRDRLARWFERGVVRRDPDPALYVYEQSGRGHAFVGVIGAVELTASGAPVFLRHEEVIEGLVDNQQMLEQTADAQVEPILALHPGSAPLDTALAAVTDGTVAPISTLTDSSGTSHRLWSVADPGPQAGIMASVPDEPVLIADGHHRHAAWRRASAGAAGHPRGSALTLLASATQPGLRLGAVHRVIAGLDLDRAIALPAVHARALAGRADALSFLAEGPVARCVFYAAGRYYAITPAEPSPGCAAPEPAVCHLHSHWVRRWGISESSVGYVHELSNAISLADTDGTAVLLPVTGIEDVFAAARDGRPLPRKATSFGPKPLVGLVFRSW